MTWPILDIVVPCKTLKDELLEDLFKSIDTQWYPKEKLNIHLITKGNSEQAKSYGIMCCKGDIICLLCTDNKLPYRSFLARMTLLALKPDVVGAYTAYYTYDKKDSALNRYFALLGANDPICWWLGKADRNDYYNPYPDLGVVSFNGSIPSIGDNGLFIKRQALQLVAKDADNHFCIDAIEDLRKLGISTYYIYNTSISHKSGSNWLDYFKRRYRYVAELYWRDYSKRRWLMVESKRDWLMVIEFAICSLLVFPMLLFPFIGYRKIKDAAWFLHPIICLGLTLIYLWAWLIHRLPRLLFRPISVQTS